MEFLQSIFGALAQALTAVLPLSPFRKYIDAFGDIPYLGWLNWFIPFRAMLVVFGAWLGVIALFYLYSIAMRWVKMIGD